MRIAHIAPINFNIPHGRSGPGRAAYNLQVALSSIGIEPVFYACKNSKAPGELRYLYKKELNSIPEFLASDGMQRGKMMMMHQALAYSEADRYDIIQSHLLEWALPFAANAPRTISVLKLTNIPNAFLQRMIAKLNNPRYMHFVSLTRSQARFLPKSVRNVTIIPEPVNTEKIRPSFKKKDWFLFVGRLTELKRPDVAMRVCIKSKKKLVVIGTPPEETQVEKYRYYVKRVKPLLKNKYIEYIPYVPHGKIFNFYRDAKALVFPTDGDRESIGTVFLEAAASGTPSLALRNELTKEVIIDKKTGLLADSEKELGALLENVSDINPLDCREHAVKNYSYETVANKYKKLYTELLKKKRT